ncbi:MAG: hypothetical protein QXK35_00005 [Nitrososphaerales archaeon]
MYVGRKLVCRMCGKELPESEAVPVYKSVLDIIFVNYVILL